MLGPVRPEGGFCPGFTLKPNAESPFGKRLRVRRANTHRTDSRALCIELGICQYQQCKCHELSGFFWQPLEDKRIGSVDLTVFCHQAHLKA
jgi:hypothetical protein